LLQDLVHAPEHLLGLRPRPVGLVPVLIQQIPVAPGVIAHRPDQAVHLAERLLAPPPARLEAVLTILRIDPFVKDSMQPLIDFYQNVERPSETVQWKLDDFAASADNPSRHH